MHEISSSCIPALTSAKTSVVLIYPWRVSNHPMKILILEDDDADYFLIEKILQSSPLPGSGHGKPDLQRAITATEALEGLASKPPDAIICDLHVPDSQGLQTAERLLDATDAALVVLTSDSDRSVAEQAVRSGAQDYLEKDHLTSERLWRSIHYAIERVSVKKEWERVRRSLEDNRRFEALARLAGGIAHDMNNTLCIVRGFTETMQDLQEPSHSEGIDQILIATDRMEDLIKRLLQAAGSEEELHLAPLNLSTFLVKSRAYLIPILPPGIQLKLDAGSNCIVESCEMHVHQILLNLVKNAVEAMNEKGDVRVTCTTDDGHVELRVSDTGPGIPQESIPFVTDPYFSTKKSEGHEGLGLSIVQGIMKSSEGDLNIESSPAGTTFTCRFPAAAPQTAKEPPVLREKTTDTSVEPKHTKVLLVDDEAPIRIVIGLQLKQLGFEVVSAGNGEEALDQFNKDPNSFHLLISDVLMPLMDGPTLVRNVHEQRPDLPVLMISGYTNGQLKDKDWYHSGIPLLTKPFQMEVFRQRVKELLAV